MSKSDFLSGCNCGQHSSGFSGSGLGAGWPGMEEGAPDPNVDREGYQRWHANKDTDAKGMANILKLFGKPGIISSGKNGTDLAPALTSQKQMPTQNGGMPAKEKPDDSNIIEKIPGGKYTLIGSSLAALTGLYFVFK